MTDKEKFLSIKTYEEFDRRREEFRGLPMDKEILEHTSKLFGKIENYTEEELYKNPPGSGKPLWE